MEFSVIICTYNRIEGLLKTLKSLERQKLPKNFSWEIVVVDNNSTDDTAERIVELRKRSALKIEYVKECAQGLSHARNKGLKVAKGEYLLFIDDDELADENLVKEVYNTFLYYKCDCVGGKIHLRPEIEMPRWLKKELWGFLTYLDYGDYVFEMNARRYPFGGNMAFRKEVFKKIGGFNVSLGRKGKKLFGGEEVELFQRLLTAGGKGVYQPKALIHHITNRSRFRKSYFRTLQFNNSYNQAIFENKDSRISLMGIPIFTLKEFFKSVKNYVSVIFSGGWDNSFGKELSICWHVGYIYGCLCRWYSRR